jgi:hypothetical protein
MNMGTRGHVSHIVQQPGEYLANFSDQGGGGTENSGVIDTCLHRRHNPIDLLVDGEQ